MTLDSIRNSCDIFDLRCFCAPTCEQTSMSCVICLHTPEQKKKEKKSSESWTFSDWRRQTLCFILELWPVQSHQKKHKWSQYLITNLSEKVKVRKILPPHGQVWFPFAKSDSCQNGGRIIRRRKKSQWMWIHLGCSITFLWPIKDANGWISQNRPVPSSPWFAASVLK